MRPKDAAYWFAVACRRIVREARCREEFEQRVALARYALGVPTSLGAGQIEQWFRDEQRRRVKRAIETYQRLRDRHERRRRPTQPKPRPQFKFARR